jgi:peptidoglycan hydrolase-like protein with peptidoglycan-binding domain
VYASPRQAHPVKERYQEIQQALAGKGYFVGEPNGEWSSDSIEALKKFQSDQNLDATGRITSLSLIALGLGPKRGASALGSAQVSDGAAGAVSEEPVTLPAVPDPIP